MSGAGVGMKKDVYSRRALASYRRIVKRLMGDRELKALLLEVRSEAKRGVVNWEKALRLYVRLLNLGKEGEKND